MKRRQREQHELKMYQKTLRYGARYDVITTLAVRELIINKKSGAGSRYCAITSAARMLLMRGCG